MNDKTCNLEIITFHQSNITDEVVYEVFRLNHNTPVGVDIGYKLCPGGCTSVHSGAEMYEILTSDDFMYKELVDRMYCKQLSKPIITLCVLRSDNDIREYEQGVGEAPEAKEITIGLYKIFNLRTRKYNYYPLLSSVKQLYNSLRDDDKALNLDLYHEMYTITIVGNKDLYFIRRAFIHKKRKLSDVYNSNEFRGILSTELDKHPTILKNTIPTMHLSSMIDSICAKVDNIKRNTNEIHEKLKDKGDKYV